MRERMNSGDIQPQRQERENCITSCLNCPLQVLVPAALHSQSCSSIFSEWDIDCWEEASDGGEPDKEADRSATEVKRRIGRAPIVSFRNSYILSDAKVRNGFLFLRKRKCKPLFRMNTLSIPDPRQSRCLSAPSLISILQIQPLTASRNQDSLQNFWTFVKKLRGHKS